jgi:ABC-2 type transport system permease protein
MSATFVNLGVSLAADRDDGTLTRLAGTPMSPAGYFAGKAILAFVVCLLEVAALLAVGVGLLGLHVPSTGGRWLTLAWVLVLGAATCSLLGLAVSSAIKATTRSAVAVMNLPYLVLSFISGVYFVFSNLPTGLQRVAAIFPLKWICQGMRSVFLPDSLLATEPAHSWEHGRIALVLAAWLVASLVICIGTFRWQGADRR